MVKTEYPRPCPIPGHPQDDDGEPVLVAESTWSRLRGWHLHAPAERLSLPAIVLTWPTAWVLHAAHVPGHVVTYTAVTATVVCWLTWRPPRAHLPARATAANRGRSRRRGHRRLGDRCCNLGAARLARTPADLDLPCWFRRRVLVAAPPRGGPRRPAAPRRPGRRARRQEAVARDPAPDRAGRLACAVAAGNEPGRGTADHHQPGERPG